MGFDRNWKKWYFIPYEFRPKISTIYFMSCFLYYPVMLNLDNFIPDGAKKRSIQDNVILSRFGEHPDKEVQERRLDLFRVKDATTKN